MACRTTVRLVFHQGLHVVSVGMTGVSFMGSLVASIPSKAEECYQFQLTLCKPFVLPLWLLLLERLESVVVSGSGI